MVYKKAIQCIFVFLFLSTNAFAANIYVRDGCSGTGNDARDGDWNTANCTDQLSTAESVAVRGDTIYVADGSYNNTTFNVAATGSTYITICKATGSTVHSGICSTAHGTDTGWVSTYGDGVATISTSITFSTGYWRFSGQTRNEEDWFDFTAYGFEVDSTDNNAQVYLYSNNVEVYYVYADAQDTLPGSTVAQYGFRGNNSSSYTGVVISRCAIDGGNNHFFIRGTNDAIIEYCAASGARSNEGNHGENVNLFHYWGPATGATVRYNHFKDNFLGSHSSEWGTATIAIASGDNYQIYGNIFENNCNADTTVGFGDHTNPYNTNNTLVYNNTFIQMSDQNDCEPFNDSRFGVRLPNNSTNSYAINNLFYGDTPSFGNVTASYSACESSCSGSNNQTGITDSVFTNYAGGVFTLSGTGNVIDNGDTLTTDGYIDYDPLGTDRDADDGWDIGAYEYGAEAVPANAIQGAVLNGVELK